MLHCLNNFNDAIPTLIISTLKHIHNDFETFLKYSVFSGSEISEIPQKSALQGVNKWRHSLLATNHNPQLYEDIKGFAGMAFYDINNLGVLQIGCH